MLSPVRAWLTLVACVVLATTSAAAQDRHGATPPGSWQVHQATVLHVDPQGQRSYTLTDHIVASAGLGDATFLVATTHAIWSVASSDVAARPRWRASPADPAVASLHADAARGFLWVVRAGDVLRLDMLDGFRETLRIHTGLSRVAAVDFEQDVLWLLGEAQLTAIDVDGQVVAVIDISADRGRRVDALRIEPPALARLRTADGVVTIDLATGRLDDVDASSWAREPEWFAPSLEIAPLADAGPVGLALQAHARCAPLACSDDGRYAPRVVVQASIDGVDVTTRLARTADDRWTLPLNPGEALPGVRVLFVGIDPYGNRVSAEVPATAAVRERAKTNALPTVRITAPLAGATAVAPAAFAIAATAADTDGTITKVEFYRNGVLLGTDATAPYSWTWASVAAGTYSLTAKAYDNAGAATLSAAVAVTVKANVAPTVTLVSPPVGAGFVAPATITLSASAADVDGTIAKVDFLRGGTTAIGTVTVKPYTYTWSNVPAGTYSLTAKATDDKGATTTSAAVTAKVNNPPSVAVTFPTSGAHLVAPASIALKATASDTDGTVAKVEFLGDGTLLGTDTSNPYGVTWNAPALGSHTIAARATDNLGAVKTSTLVTFSVDANQPPTVALTSPSSSVQRVAGTMLPLAASASDPDGTIARVEFRLGGVLVASDATPPYSASIAVPLWTAPLTAVAIDNLGLATTSPPITLTGVANQAPTVRLDAPIDGAGFLTSTVADIPLQATATDPDGTIVRVRLMAAPLMNDDTEGPPITVATLTSPPYSAVWHAVAPAVDPLVGYRIWAEADDDAATTAESDRALVFVSTASAWTADIVEPRGSTIELEAPATIVVAARARYAYSNPAADPLQRVELLDGAVVVGTLTAPNGAGGEHVFVLRNVPRGVHLLQVRTTDAIGLQSTSVASRIDIVAPNQPPTVALQAPLPGEMVLPSTNAVAIGAAAADPDGSITRLQVVGDGWFESDLAPPGAQGTWPGVIPGAHVVVARATDNAGRESETRPVFVDVLASPASPVVAILSPAPGGPYVPGRPLTLTAAAGGSAPIARVDYITLHNNNVVGSSTVAPYQVSWSPGPVPTTLRAVAYSTNGRTGGSADVPLDILTNLPPTALLTAPRDGDEFTVGQAARVDAVAGDNDGTITSVRFTANGALIGTDTTTPYGVTWTPGTAGVYVLTATATDNQGQTTTSTAVNVNVVPAVAAVTITSPTAGAVVASGSAPRIVARAVMPGRSISRVEYSVDGGLIGSTSVPVPGTVVSTAFTWSAPTIGMHVLTARAVAVDGTSLTSPPVSITVDDYSIALVDPAPDQVFILPAEVRIHAAPTGTAIARVEFLGDGAIIGTSTAAPYVMVWRSPGTGWHTVGARAVDATGRVVSATAQVRLATAPDITIGPGQDNALVADDVVTVSGVVVAPRNAAVIVEGRRASLDPAGNFRVENVPLAPGANSLTVTVNTADAPPVKRTLLVNSTGSAPFSVDLSPQDGFAPLAGRLTIRNRAKIPFARIDVDIGDNGTIDATLTAMVDDEAYVEYTAPGAGVYVFKVTIDDASNNVIYQARRQLRVFDRAELAGTVLGTYYTMVERLAVGDGTSALRLFTGDSQARYADIFATLGSDLPAAAADLRRLVDGVIGDDIAELTISRDGTQGPTLFMVYLIRGRDGIWRLESL